MNNRLLNECIEERNKLRDNGCNRMNYLYYTKGYLCNSKNFLCSECWFKIVKLSEMIKELKDELAVDGEK